MERSGDRQPLLEVDDITLRFGGVVALDNVSFNLYEGEILGLIGPNGAGKTTCFNAMTGVYRPTAGEVRFAARRIVGRKKYKITRAGIARTFQNIRLFPEMTALENVLVGADARHKTSVPGGAVPTAPPLAGGARGARGRDGDDAVRRHRAAGRRTGPQPVLRRTAAAGDRAGAGYRAEAAVPGRAGRGLQPGREGGSARADPADPRPAASRSC